MISYVSLATKNIENGANANPQGKNEKGKISDGNWKQQIHVRISSSKVLKPFLLKFCFILFAHFMQNRSSN